MKRNLDIKSVIIGLMGGILLIGALSFKTEDSQRNGRYQTAVYNTPLNQDHLFS